MYVLKTPGAVLIAAGDIVECRIDGFEPLVNSVKDLKQTTDDMGGVGAMSVVTKLLLGLSFLAIVDVAIPLPIVAIVLIYVVLQKPDWFPKVVGKVYGDDEKS